MPKVPIWMPLTSGLMSGTLFTGLIFYVLGDPLPFFSTLLGALSGIFAMLAPFAKGREEDE